MFDKTYELKEMFCDGIGWKEKKEKAVFRIASRWMNIKHNYNPGKRNSLWDYVQDENGYKPYQNEFNLKNGLYLDYFRYHGKNYAIEQFYALGNPFWCPYSYMYRDENGKDCFLSGVDKDNYYNPIYIEIACDGEMVRVWERIEK